MVPTSLWNRQRLYQTEAIGEVTATSNYIYYYSYDQDDEDYKLWWTYNSQNKKSMITKTSNEFGGGTLGSVMAALTGDKTAATPGLLNKTEGGFSDRGGYISLNFRLNATNAFTYAGSNSSTSVGSITMYIYINNTDTEQTVRSSTAKQSLVDRNVYRIDNTYEDVHMTIHADATTRDKIYMNYKCLRLGSIGLEQTNVLSENNATNAINEIADALQLVSAQRSRFVIPIWQRKWFATLICKSYSRQVSPY